MGIEATIRREIRMRKAPADLADLEFFRKCSEKQAEIGRKLVYLLNTGNLVSSTGLDLMQTSGFTVVADKINYMRFLTHFRRYGVAHVPLISVMHHAVSSVPITRPDSGVWGGNSDHVVFDFDCGHVCIGVLWVGLSLPVSIVGNSSRR